MGALTGNTISSSYLGLLKTSDNAILNTSLRLIEDGGGTDASIKLSTTQLGLSDGTTTVPSLTFSSNSDTGFYYASDVTYYTLNGVTQLAIGSASLTLNNDSELRWGTSDVFIKGTTATDNIQIGLQGATKLTLHQTNGLTLAQYGSGSITGTVTQRLGVTSSGQVVEIPIGGGAVDGSGTAGKITKWSDSDTITDSILSESSSTIEIGATTPILKFNNLAGGGLDPLLTATGTDFTISTTSRTPMTIDLSGGLIKMEESLGLGNISPTSRLEIAGGSLPSGTVTNLGISTALTTGRTRTYDSGSLASIGARGDATAVELVAGSSATWFTGIGLTARGATAASGTIIGYTRGVEKFRVDADGDFGIGVTNPTNKLHVGGDTLITGGLTVYGNSTIGDNFADAHVINGSTQIRSTNTSTVAVLDVTRGDANNEGANATDFRFVASNRAITTERANMEIYTNDDQAADMGASLGFGGRHTDASTNDSLFATIKAGKTNSTSAEFGGYLTIGTAKSDSDIVERFRITQTGELKLTNSDGIRLSAQVSNLYATSGTLSFYGTDNAVYLNGAGANGWLRLNAAGGENGRNTIDIFGSSASSPDTINFRTVAGDRARFNGAGVLTVGSTTVQTQARLNVRENGSGIEFGHTNTSDFYFGTLGSLGSNGSPFISWSCMNEHNVNTFTTKGAKGNLIRSNTAGELLFQQVTATNTTGQTPVTRIELNSSGRLTLNTYGSGTHTGTATRFLAVDTNGRVIEEATSTIDGSGTAGKIVKWSDSDTITDSILSESGTAITITSTAPEFLFSETGSSITNRIYGDGGNLHIDVDNGASSSGNLKILNQGTTFAMFKGSSGALGIGTTSIDEKLQVEEGNIKIEGGANSSTVGLIIAHGGQTGNTTNLVQNSSSSFGHLFTTDRRLVIEAGSNGSTGTAETLDFFVNGSERMMIDTTGQVGIGTTTPNHLLDVESTGASMRVYNTTSDANTEFYVTTNGTTGASKILFGDTADADIGKIIYRHNGNSMAFETNDSEAVRIDTSGRLFVGHTTTLLSSSEKFSVSAGTNGVNVFSNSSTGNGTLYLQNANTSTTDWQTYLIFQDGTGNRGQMGIFYNTSTLGISGQGGIEFKTGATSLASGTTHLQISSTGNVGVGGAPTSKFSVTGMNSSNFVDLKGSGPGGSRAIRFIDGDTATKFNWLLGAQHNVDNAFEITPSTAVGGTTFNSPIVVINKDYEVGIGTTSPGRPLHIKSSNDSPIQVESTDDTTGILFKDNNSSNALFYRGTGNYFYTTSRFNVGDLGATASTTALGVSATSYDAGNSNGNGEDEFLALFQAGTNSVYKQRYVKLAQTFTGGAKDSPIIVFESNHDGDNHKSYGTIGVNSDGTFLFSNIEDQSSAIAPGSDIPVTTKMQIDSTGKVIINDDVNIQGTTFSAGFLNFNSSGNVRLSANDDVRIGYSGAFLTVKNTGLVGIGVTSPAFRLHVDSADGNVALFQGSRDFGLKLVETSVDSGLSQMQIIGNNSSSSYNALHLRSATGTGLVIDTSNNVIVGGDANGDAGAISFQSDFQNGAGNITFNRNTTLNSSRVISFKDGGSLVSAITYTASSVTYGTGSDYRLKEDYKDFDALEIASNIKMYDFKWKNEDKRSYGVIAHELQDILPEAVIGEKDGEEMQGVDYSKLVPILLKSIQELEARVKELEKEI